MTPFHEATVLARDLNCSQARMKHDPQIDSGSYASAVEVESASHSGPKGFFALQRVVETYQIVEVVIGWIMPSVFPSVSFT